MPLTHVPAPPPTIIPHIEIRERFERRLNRDLASSTDDARSDLLTRIRLGVDVGLRDGWAGGLQIQFSQGKGYATTGDSTVEDTDLSLAYFRHAVRGGELTLGRQKIDLGNQRLVGSLEWANVPRSFDGVRFQNATLDTFAVRIGVATVRSPNAFLAGLSSVGPSGRRAVLFKVDDGPAGRSDVLTLDRQGTVGCGAFTLEAQGAVQVGRVAGKDLAAWAAHARISRKLTRRATASVEGNGASGGSGPNAVSTFDNLYPTNHPFYGIMDLQGWRNMAELAAGLDLKLRPDLTAKLGYHRFGLMNGTDAWYGASGTPNLLSGAAIDPTGKSGRDVGQELDIDAAWTPNKSWGLSAGFGLFLPGRFVDSLAGSSANQTWGFVQLQMRF